MQRGIPEKALTIEALEKSLRLIQAQREPSEDDQK
jgi:hypothetical protein